MTVSHFVTLIVSLQFSPLHYSTKITALVLQNNTTYTQESSGHHSIFDSPGKKALEPFFLLYSVFSQFNSIYLNCLDQFSLS